MSSTKQKSNAQEIQELAEFYINKHVIKNQTVLINDALQFDIVAGIHHDNIQNYNPWSDQQDEVLQWWLVSDWLGNKLNLMGEVLLCSDCGDYWGRTSSGQNIIHDGIFQVIAKAEIDPINSTDQAFKQQQS